MTFLKLILREIERNLQYENVHYIRSYTVLYYGYCGDAERKVNFNLQTELGHQINMFLKSYKIKTVLSVHAQMVFKLLINKNCQLAFL